MRRKAGVWSGCGGWLRTKWRRGLRGASLFVNLNLVEGFNATVAEAMASGCPSFTYDAICGRDYLVGGGPRQNAFVFGNGDIVSLAEQLFETLASWDDDETQAALRSVTEQARSAVQAYRPEATRSALESFLGVL